MKLVLTSEQSEFVSSLRDLFADVCPPTLVRQMKEPDSDGFPPEALGGARRGGGVRSHSRSGPRRLRGQRL